MYTSDLIRTPDSFTKQCRELQEFEMSIAIFRVVLARRYKHDNDGDNDRPFFSSFHM